MEMHNRKTPLFPEYILHGLPAGWTIYGGTQLADRYRAFNFGIGKNMGHWALCLWI